MPTGITFIQIFWCFCVDGDNIFQGCRLFPLTPCVVRLNSAYENPAETPQDSEYRHFSDPPFRDSFMPRFGSFYVDIIWNGEFQEISCRHRKTLCEGWSFLVESLIFFIKFSQWFSVPFLYQTRLWFLIKIAMWEIIHSGSNPLQHPFSWGRNSQAFHG